MQHKLLGKSCPQYEVLGDIGDAASANTIMFQCSLYRNFNSYTTIGMTNNYKPKSEYHETVEVRVKDWAGLDSLVEPESELYVAGKPKVNEILYFHHVPFGSGRA